MMSNQKQTETGNFYKALLAHSCMIVGYSIFEIVMLYLLVQDYHVSAALLGIFGMIGVIPAAAMGFLAPFLDRMRNRKRWLLWCQEVEFTALLVLTAGLLQHIPVGLIALVNFILVATSTLANSVEIGFIPQILFGDEDKIEKTVDIQYILSSILGVLTGIFSSAILLLIGTNVLFVSSLAFALLGICFYLAVVDVPLVETQELEREETATGTYRQELGRDIAAFLHTFPAVMIIFSEAILGGLTGLLFQLLPITMKEIGVSVALFAFVNAVQQAGDAAGGILAPLIKMRSTSFFILDYLISGGCFAVIGFTNVPNVVRLGLLFVASVVMGMSGNTFEKLMYRSFSTQNITSMHAITSTVFSVFSIIGFLAALINVQTLVFWVGVGLVTVGCGLLILITRRKVATVL